MYEKWFELCTVAALSKIVPVARNALTGRPWIVAESRSTGSDF
jgi:hypothetical protein